VDPGVDQTLNFLSAVVGTIGTVLSVALLMWLATIVAL